MRAAAFLLAVAGTVMAEPAALPKGFYNPSGDVPTVTGAVPGELSSLRWLLYDGHAAPHVDTLGFVRNAFNAASGKVSSVCFYLYCDKAHRQLAGEFNASSSADWAEFLGHIGEEGNLEAQAAKKWLTQAGKDASAAALATPAGQRLVNELDIATCSFPGHNCMRLAATGKTLLIRFAHRFDHWTRPEDLSAIQAPETEFFQVQAGWPVMLPEYIKQLKELAASPKHIVAVTNAFDWMYLFHYTGIRALAFPTTGAVGAPEWDPASTDKIPIIPGHAPQNRAIAWFTQSMREFEEAKGVPLRVRYEPEYNAGGMSKYPCAVAIPYSLHAGMVVEAYASGVPLLAPSLDFAAKMHATCGLVSHWTAQNMPRLTEDYLARIAECAESASQSGMQSPIKVEGEAAAREWLSLADLYRLPHITYFDSLEQMYRLLSAMLSTPLEERREQSNQQRQYMADLRTYTAINVGAAVLKAVRASAEPLSAVAQPAGKCDSVSPRRGCLAANEPLPGSNPTTCPAACDLCKGRQDKKLNPLRSAHQLAGGYGGYAGYAGYSETSTPTGNPATSAPSGSPATSPPSSSPATSAPTTAAPTIAISAGTTITPRTLSPAAIASNPTLNAINTRAVVPLTNINIASALGTGTKTFPSLAGLPAVSLTITTTPTVTTGGSAQTASIAVSISRNAVLADAGGYKTAVAFMFAQELGINVAQIFNLLIRFADGATVGRKAQALQDSATITFGVCGTTSGCSSIDDDDDFPGWAIALAVVLPIVGIAAIVGIVVFVCSGSSSSSSGEQQMEDKQPYGGDQAV
eukprot:TRINITY_DN187_c0_g1_i3.p1 TRINITY_DN187_c0_g1~~TRINITY_DN187_c0_g1_i3.p1  ORF type:complete len:837 (+),score=313.05 TRINITY_DN187_c0_g1_i3:101-2512(+)